MSTHQQMEDGAQGDRKLSDITEYCSGGWGSDEDFQQHCQSFTPCVFRIAQPFRLKNLNPFHSNQITSAISRKRVEVSCSQTKEFHGHPLSRTKTNITFAEFLSAFLSDDSHTVESTTLCDAHVYLSQCCVHSIHRHEIEVPEMEHFALTILPPIIPRTDLQSINLWANIHPSLSGVHYDANHNILFVIQGRKTVWLFPPSLTAILQPYTAYGESPNHSHLSPQTILSRLQEQNHGLSGYSKVELTAGHALFIPEGWWHMVESTERTVALNYWFSSPLQKLLQQSPHMAPYMLRACVHSLTEKQLEAAPSTAICGVVVSSLPANEPESLLGKRKESPSSPMSTSFASFSHSPRVSSSSSSSSMSSSCSANDETSWDLAQVWHEKLLPACKNATEFTKTWLTSAKENPAQMTRAVQDLCTPAQAMYILRQWDNFTTAPSSGSNSNADDDNDDLFERLFSLLGEENASSMHQTLMGQQAIWRQLQGDAAVQRALGK